MSYDLHTHSLHSDGTLTPIELVHAAHAADVRVLALTDHDSTDGLVEAEAAVAALNTTRVPGTFVPMTFVPGIEISVSWAAQTVHVVGLHIDPRHAPLQAGIAALRDFRESRAREMARRLEKAGIPGAYEGARRFQRGAILSRTHFARYLVESGHARDMRDVFHRFLVMGRPGHVPGQWAQLEEAVAWIRGAGGQAVLAHPARYKVSATRLRQLLAEFQACGGAAIEVVSGSHSRDDCLRFAEVARKTGLLASRGSDYHGPENPWVALGRLPDLPADLRPVWVDWLAA